jgi:regulator of RNase E activity RraA
MSASTLPTSDDAALLRALEQLYSAVVCDVLDTLGARHQALPAHIRPLSPHTHISGRVFSARAIAVSEQPAEPYKLEIAAVDAMQAGDVLVVDAQDDRQCGFWGELLTTACLYKGVRGVVMSACTRDMWKLKETTFPVFGIGYHPADSRARADIVEIGGPIKIGDVAISSGDFLLGDEDGVVIVPRALAPEAIRLALEKVAGENIVRDDLMRGVPIGEVFAKHGIL